MTSKGAILQEFTYEWLTVTQGGQVQQLTHFGAVFTHTEIGDSSWSPDGLRLAFWLDAKPSPCEGPTLAILDTTTRKTTDYCLLGSDDPGAPALKPVWSLDGQYLAVDQYTGRVSHTIVVNTLQDWAAQVAEHVGPAGWLATP
jgi:Tol biopolymer transport system component